MQTGGLDHLYAFDDDFDAAENVYSTRYGNEPLQTGLICSNRERMQESPFARGDLRGPGETRRSSARAVEVQPHGGESETSPRSRWSSRSQRFNSAMVRV